MSAKFTISARVRMYVIDLCVYVYSRLRLECAVCPTDGDLALQGSLGSLSLSDLTPHGDLYRERFTTRGGEALVFNIHKY